MDFTALERAINAAINEAAENQGQWPEADILKLGRMLGEKSDLAFELFRAE